MNTIKKALFQFVLGSSLLVSDPAFSAIFYDMDTTVPLRCVFSSTHQNRILVSGGRIQKVIFPQVRMDVQMEEESGQVFVYALGPLMDAVTLSVVTDTGVVQDLLISFQEDASPEVVILQDPVPCEVQDRCEQPLDQAQQIALAIRQLLSQQVPVGYVCVGQTGESRYLKSGVMIETLARFESDCETLYLYRVANVSYHVQSLYEQQLSIPGTCWVYLEKQCLKPKEAILAVVAVRR